MRLFRPTVLAAFFAASVMISLGGPVPADPDRHTVVAINTPPLTHTDPPSLPGRQSAAPTVSSVALSSSDGTGVACPATIHVTANVTGTAGKYLHVVVRAYFNGAFVAIDGSQSIPDDVMLTTGTYARAFAVSLPVLNGESGDGVQLTAWQDGDAFPFTTASTNAQFKPTCQPPPTATPTAAPSPTPAPPNGRDLGIPTNLLAVHNAQTCQGLVLSSTVGSGCASAVQKGDLVLAWSYKSLAHCIPACTTPSGFVVERASYEGGPFQAYQLVAYQSQTPDSDGIIMSVPYATTYGQCYRVSALHGANDVGIASTPICIKADAVTLDPSGMYQAHKLVHNKFDSCSPDSNSIGIGLTAHVPSGGFIVGWRDRESDGIGCGEQYYDRYQGVIVFPIDTLQLKQIAHATLTATIVGGAVNAGVPYKGDGNERAELLSCISHIGFPTNYKPGASMPLEIAFDDAVDPPDYAPRVAIDVTGMVHAWLNPGGVNNGMVLSTRPNSIASDQNDPPGGNNSECLSVLTNPRLVITY